MVFEVLGKPQGKARPRFTRYGHTYTPNNTTDYEKAVRLAFLKAKGKMLEGEEGLLLQPITLSQNQRAKRNKQRC